MARVIVFDVNETLLDLRALDREFERAFGDRAARQEWFGQLLQTALVHTVIDDYRDFATIGRAALDMVCERRSKMLSEDERRRVLAGMRNLPPHPDVRPALDRLREAGARLATLTNSPLRVIEQQLASAGIASYFEKVLSADSVRRLKPAAEPYQHAARELGVDVTEVRLVAAHAWDVAGALAAGCAAAFVRREGKVLDPLARQPDIVGSDLEEVAGRILERDLRRAHAVPEAMRRSAVSQ